MQNRTATALAIAMGLLLIFPATGCSNKGGDDPSAAPATPAQGSAAERPSLTAAECEARGGRVVGDIGDGAIHRPDYTCEGGQPPIGTIRADGDGPIAVEGSVCCPTPP